MIIESYSEKYKEDIAALILNIQNNEFNVPVTLNDQQDLLDIENFYCKNNGGFWLAIENEKLIGTIALIDIGGGQAALRKMFVHAGYRGKEKAIGQSLLNYLIEWCNQKCITEIYLGTVEQLYAAKRFYIKNGFEKIEKNRLPKNFPLMQVDTEFFKLQILSDKVKKFVGEKLVFLFDTNVYRRLVEFSFVNKEEANIKTTLLFRDLVSSEVEKKCNAIRSLTVARELISHLTNEDREYETCKLALRLQEMHTQNKRDRLNAISFDMLLSFFFYRDSLQFNSLSNEREMDELFIQKINTIVYSQDKIDEIDIERINKKSKILKSEIKNLIKDCLDDKKSIRNDYVDIITEYLRNKAETNNHAFESIKDKKIAEFKTVFGNALEHFRYLFDALAKDDDFLDKMKESKWNFLNDFIIVFEWCFIKYYNEGKGVEHILVTEEKSKNFASAQGVSMHERNDDVWNIWEYFEFLGYRINKSVPGTIEVSDHGFIVEGVSKIKYSLDNPIWASI
jgi:putative acetyltransferase